MTPERWDRVKQLLASVVERPREQRGAFLDEACAGDLRLRAEVEALAAAHDEAGAFLESPVSAPAGSLPRAVAPGDRFGPYEVVALVGAGGMGEVYRARDTRLDRDVALKVLPGDMAWNPDRLRRFEEEARPASSLNHPHILAVYDVGRHDGMPYLVTELLEGRTLAERIAQGPVPLRKALEWGAQAARALAAAHERGIVHRDIKPSNLFVTAGGAFKLLDFGLAKPGPPAPWSTSAASGSRPTTSPGTPMGTIGYMSPEQLRGDAVDFRSDQFSLGCVLYELLAGREPFAASTAAESLAAVLGTEPPPLDRTVPRTVAWIVERCLAKDPEDRYGATRDLARDLELALARLSELTLPTAAPAARRSRWARGALVALLAAAIVAAGWRLATRDAEPAAVPVVRYLTFSGHESFPAAAPDGRTIAFTSTRDGRRRIWLKQLATGSEVPLTSGEDEFARFSPDGSEVLFTRYEAAGRASLYRVPSVGGEPRRVVADALYGDFSPDGRHIAFVRGAQSPDGAVSVVGVVGADGSGIRELARLPAALVMGSALAHPRWSPDGRFLAGTRSTSQLGEPTTVTVLDVDSGVARRLHPPSDAGVWRGGLVWTGPRQIVCAQPESVVGQQTGTSSRIVLVDVSSGAMRPLLSSPVNLQRLDVLGPGRLVLEAGSLRQSLRELPLSPRGGAGERWMTEGNSADRQPTYSGDGEWIAFSSNRSGNLDLWAVSRTTGAVRRLTDDPAQDSDPGFTPDGRLVWASNRGGRFEVWIAEADGSGARQVTNDGVDAENPVATPDGAWIVYASANPRSRGIMKVRPDGRDAALVVPGNLIEPEVSPDGRHVAFVEDHGTPQAALRVARLADGARVGFEVRFPRRDPGRTVDEGRSRWLPDGRAIAYVGRDGDGTYAVFVQEFRAGADTAKGRRRVGVMDPDLVAESFGISPDGRRIAISYRRQVTDLMLADGVPGVAGRPAR